jgi:hypothetical protein
MMFAVIYQFYLKPGREADYQVAWHTIATYFKTHRGAIGSCLHFAGDGRWVAYSRWPDKKTRDASWPGENDPSFDLPSEIQSAILTMKDCTDQERKIPEICLEVAEDLLLPIEAVKNESCQ